MEAAESAARSKAEKARAAFDSFCRTHSVPVSDTAKPGDGIFAAWKEETGVPVRIVALDPAREPADVPLAVVVLEVLLDLNLGEMGVAVLVEEAVGGGQDRAGAVEVDGAAFHDDKAGRQVRGLGASPKLLFLFS